MIVCGWCGHPTRDSGRCDHCRHTEPTVPFTQRGVPVPDASTLVRRRLAEAEAAIRATGGHPTVVGIAEHLGVSDRTVRRWRELSG